MTELRREAREIDSLRSWLAWRQNCITASRVGALFDCHKYLTREQLAAELRGESRGSNAAMRRGRVLEPAVAAAIAEDHSQYAGLRKATTFNLLPDLRLGCTPDYLVDTDVGLVNVQCKTVSPQEWESWQGRAPLFYQLQVVTENLVLDTAAGVLAVMVVGGSFPLHLFDIPRHPGAEWRVLAAVTEWWRAWDAGEIAGAAPRAEIAAELDDGSHRDLSSDNLLPVML